MTEPTSLRVASAETISTSTTSIQSSAIGTNSGNVDYEDETVRIISDASVWLEFGSDPTAVAESAGAIRLPADTVEYFKIKAGDKVAAILASGTGKLNVARMR